MFFHLWSILYSFTRDGSDVAVISVRRAKHCGTDQHRDFRLNALTAGCQQLAYTRNTRAALAIDMHAFT